MGPMSCDGSHIGFPIDKNIAISAISDKVAKQQRTK
jgi:hypothetical protein